MKPRSVRFHRVAVCVSLLAALSIPCASMGEETAISRPQTAAKQPANKVPSQKKAKRKQVAPPKPAEIPPAAPASEEPMGDFIGMADAPRDYLAESFVGLVSDIDRFFGDDRNYLESNDSVLQLDLSRVMGYGGERRFVLSGRAKVHLPNTEKRLHLLIESDPDKNTSSDPARRQAVKPVTKTTPESYGAGVRYEKVKEERWHYSTDAGLKFQGLNTTPFMRGRVSYAMPLGEWRLKAAETVFWFNTIGAGETTQFDFERTISEPLLFRATSNATWLHDRQNMDLRQDLVLFHTLNDRTALLYQASAIGVSRPQSHVTDYVVLLLYRYRLHRQWMYFEIGPQVHFPKERNFRSSGMLGFRLEMLFDDSK